MVFRDRGWPQDPIITEQTARRRAWDGIIDPPSITYPFILLIKMSPNQRPAEKGEDNWNACFGEGLWCCAVGCPLRLLFLCFSLPGPFLNQRE